MVVGGDADRGAGGGAGEEAGVAEPLAARERLGEAPPDEQGTASEGGAVVGPVHVPALGEAYAVHAVGGKGEGGAHSPEMAELAVNDDVADGEACGLAEVGAVDRGCRVEPTHEFGEGLGAADAAGGERGRDDDTRVCEVRRDDMEGDPCHGASGIGYGIGRGEPGREEETEDGGKGERREGKVFAACSAWEGDRPPPAFLQSRMSSRFQPKASSKQSPEMRAEFTASSRRVHQTWSPASCLPRGAEMSAWTQLAQVGT